MLHCFSSLALSISDGKLGGSLRTRLDASWWDLSIAGSFLLLGAFRCCSEKKAHTRLSPFPPSLLAQQKAHTRLSPFPPPLLAQQKAPTGLPHSLQQWKAEWGALKQGKMWRRLFSPSKTSMNVTLEFWGVKVHIVQNTHMTVRTLLRVILTALSTLISSPCIFETCYTGSK